MEKNKTYGYDTRNIKRFLLNTKVDDKAYLDNVVSLYYDSFDYDPFDVFKENKKMKPQIPEIILLKEEDNIFYELFTNKVIIDLNSNYHSNGLLIDKEEFVNNLILNDGSLAISFAYFNKEENKERFMKSFDNFITNAKYSYIEVSDQIDRKELKQKINEYKLSCR